VGAVGGGAVAGSRWAVWGAGSATLGDRVAAVDGQAGAGHEVGRRGGEEQRRGGNVLGFFPFRGHARNPRGARALGARADRAWAQALRRPSRIFTSRAWLADDGDPSRPREVLGVPVTERLGSRRDAPGALVRLGDRRYALTGSTVAVGVPRQLDRYLRRRARHAGGGDDWYAEARRLLRTSARPVARREPV
jgi:hypothetical protein